MARRFLTDTDVIDVPQEKADELALRLRGSAAKAIANADDRGVRFTAREKADVLAALGNWILAAGVDALGGELAELRTALMRDLRVAPFS
jgi:Tfp pilus assembly protein FimV